MQLEPTGERVIEEHYQSSPQNYLIYLFHVVTYNFALPHVRGKAVLDYGCGSGYGSHHVAPHCESIVGIDIAEDAVGYARSHYRADNLDYRRIEPAHRAPLPFESARFDTVLSFQVIEHIADVDPYLAEIHRVLKPGGVFVCATPDRSTRLLPLQKPWNEWHVHEYDREGLRRALSTRFDSVEVLGMGGRSDVMDIEIRRTRKAMWLTLPLTAPWVPDLLRVPGLKLLKRLRAMGTRATPPRSEEFGFGESDLRIEAAADPSVNLVAVARKR